MNIAFYVSGNAGRLRKILALGDQELVNSTKLIFSDDTRNSDLQATAAPLGIDYHCLNFKDIPRTEKPKSLTMSDVLLNLLRERNIDYCFSFGAHLLAGELLKEYEHKIINFHPSVLPDFPGLSAIDQAVAAKSNLLGNTAHFIDKGIDTGPVIMQNVVSYKVFKAGDYDSILDRQIPMLLQIFRWLKDSRLFVRDGAVIIEDADYQRPAFFPALEDA